MGNFKNKTIYQIYPKSFYDSNGDGFGDLRGIIEKLDYFSYLGVDMIWMTPFFVSPQNDNGYDVEDYYNIDPRYGTMEDFELLSKEASERGISIMLDMVLNHTSTKHIWFQKALQGEEKYKEYYIFKKGRENGSAPTNWISKFGGNAWKYVESMDEYYLHLFDVTQADLNWENPEVRAEVSKIVEFWMRKGAKGFRFDVVNLISKPLVYEDDFEGDGRRFYTDGPRVHEYLRELNHTSFGKDADIVTVGEMSSTTIENCVQYAGEDSHELSMVFNFHHLKVDYKDMEKWKLKPFDFAELKNLFFTWQLGMQEHNAWNALFWSNHDQPRAVSRFGDDVNYPVESGKMLANAIHFMRGTPYIYQGEEIGMKNAYFDKLELYRDVESLNYYNILKSKGYSEQEIYKILQTRSRDNARTPMQWNATKHGGFTIGTPWIPAPEDYHKTNVDIERKDSNFILEHYRRLIQLRKEYTVISEGKFIPMLEEHSAVFAYKRILGDEELIVLNNFYGNEACVELEEVEGYEVLISNYPNKEISKKLSLAPYESIVYYRQLQK